MIRPYNSDNIRFNKDELTLIDNKDEINSDSVHQAIKDLKGNGKDWIIDAVDEAFEKIRQKNCKIHEAELQKHAKKLQRHDWYIGAIAATVAVIIFILIFSSCR